jgi:hypothetical protein
MVHLLGWGVVKLLRHAGERDMGGRGEDFMSWKAVEVSFLLHVWVVIVMALVACDTLAL